MPSSCRQVNWGNCGIPWVNYAVRCVKDDWKRQFWACAIACQNCAVYSVSPSCMTSHSKTAQFNWECIGRFRRIQRGVIINVHTHLHIKHCGYSCRILIERGAPRRISEKYSNMKFHENPSGWSRVVPSGQMDGRTDTTKLTVAFSQFLRTRVKIHAETNSNMWEGTKLPQSTEFQPYISGITLADCLKPRGELIPTLRNVAMFITY